MSITVLNLAEKRRKAESWVDGYTAIAIATVLTLAIVPMAATGALCTLEGIMCYQIGKIYKQDFTMADGTAVAEVIGLAAFAGQIAAMEAAILAGPFALAIKPVIAAAIVKGMGELIIGHFEDCAQCE